VINHLCRNQQFGDSLFLGGTDRTSPSPCPQEVQEEGWL